MCSSKRNLPTQGALTVCTVKDVWFIAALLTVRAEIDAA